MRCTKCSGDIIHISAKCYDNVTISSEKKYTGDMGYKYDGRDLSISYCTNCGMVQTEFPLRIHEVIDTTPILETTNSMLVSLESNLRDFNFKQCSILLDKLYKRIPASEYNFLLELYSKYIDIHRVVPDLPELYGWVHMLIRNYR